jgi:hypothetical protein
VNATLPSVLSIFLLIALGFVLRRVALGDEKFWAGADRITYYVFLPALLCRGLATADLAGLPVLPAVLLAGGAILAVTGLLYAVRGPLGFANAAFGSTVQGAIRTNTYIALAAALALYGEEGLPAIALAVAAFIPMVNLVSVWTLARSGRGGGTALLRQVVLNPLILACAAGVALNLNDRGLPALADQILDLLGRAALPLGLIAVGAGFAFDGLFRSLKAILAASIAKFLLLPGLLLAGLWVTKLSGTEAGVLMLFAAAPTSVSSYILARQMGGDYKLMAAIITVQTLLAAAVLPLWISLTGRFT